MMKKVKKLSSLNHANITNSNREALLKWGSKLIVSLMLVYGFNSSNAQPLIYQFEASEWNTIETIATTNTSAAESAKGVLILVKGMYFDDAIIEKNTDIESLSKTTKATTIEPVKVTIIENRNLLLAYPNPANHTVFIKYTVVNKLPNNTIIITDASGKTILFKKLFQPNGLLEIDTKDLKEGIYFVQLSNSKYGTVSTKISIIH